MKTIKLLILVPALFLMSFSTYAPGMTDAERKAAVDHLQTTKANLMSAVKGLSTAQLNYKSTPESWSVAECVEHITIAENMLFGMAEGSLQVDADPSKRVDVKMSDEEIVGMITDRTNKVKTQEPFEPKNNFGSYEGTLKEFTSKRDAHIEFVKKTDQDVRNHYCTLQFGTIDTYQAIMFMSGHTERHTKQILEVKADAGFPKK